LKNRVCRMRCQGERFRIGKSECGSGKGLEVGSGNAEVGKGWKLEVGMWKWERKGSGKSECGSGKELEVGMDWKWEFGMRKWETGMRKTEISFNAVGEIYL
jgi:hypothetical protein